ncbi:MAG: tetratricopeptide repeat protein, partial [Gemmatimonadetes bacterium]|nr:tetratricopeptide repeat protein [Gemmatimonadota bacterium]
LDYSLVERTLIAARALWFYAGKLLWPSELAVIYPLWDIRVSNPLAWGYLVAAVALVVALWHFRQRVGRGPLAGALFFVVTLSPVLGFVDYGYMQTAFVAERFQYLAGIGVIAAVVGGVAQGICRLSGLWQRGARVVCSVVIGVLGMLTWQHQEAWLNEESFWRHVIANNPTAAIGYLKLGDELGRQGRDSEGLDVYSAGAAQVPSSLRLHVNMAISLIERERFEGGALVLQHILKHHPDSAAAHLNLGYALYCLRLPSQAERHLSRAVALDPSVAAAHLNLGNALYTLRRYQEAVQSFDRALALDPSLQKAHANRAAALQAIQQQRQGEPAGE